jgi:hypothetical protein
MRGNAYIPLLLTTASLGLAAMTGHDASAQLRPGPRAASTPAPMPIASALPIAPALALQSTITSVRPHAPAWYKADTHQYLLDVGGTDGRCGLQSTWTRREDGAKLVLPYGEVVMPAPGWAGLFQGQLGPGQWTVTVEGSTAYAPYFKPCQGSAQATVAAYEGALGAEFPRIAGATWEGATAGGAGVYRTGQADKILDVSFQNYLVGYKWNGAAATQQGAVCTFSVVVSGPVVGGEWPDPYTAVLGDSSGNTGYYRGLVMTGVGWSATLKVDATKIISQYMPLTPGMYSVQIRSTPFNRNDAVVPCIGSMATSLKVE